MLSAFWAAIEEPVDKTLQHNGKTTRSTATKNQKAVRTEMNHVSVRSSEQRSQ